MLDKTIAYKNIIMRADAFLKGFTVRLPEGFSIKPYEAGDEMHWAAIETSVGEFDTQVEAEDYFQKTYIPYSQELERRCFFVIAQDGTYAGTCTAWYMMREDGQTGVVHWFGVRPEYQGLGIGKALLGKVMQYFEEINAYPVYLHTQTWSHKAIGMYHMAGFGILKEESFDNNQNDFTEAMDVLKAAVDAVRLKSWADAAI